MSDKTLCANCGHSKEAHWDGYGCEVEGPDVWVEGTNCGGLVASGPCGCMDFVAERDYYALREKILCEERNEQMRELYYDFRSNL